MRLIHFLTFVLQRHFPNDVRFLCQKGYSLQSFTEPFKYVSHKMYKANEKEAVEVKMYQIKAECSCLKGNLYRP